MPRFVILEHDHPFLHWDLMLEAGNVLRTWRLLRTPVANEKIAAELLDDHRLLYLDYEGPVSRGRGTVVRWDHGTYRGDLPEMESIDQSIVIELEGQKLQGTMKLAICGDGGWQCEFVADD